MKDNTNFAEKPYPSVSVWGMYAGVRKLIPDAEAASFWRNKRDYLERTNHFPGLNVEGGKLWPDFLR